FRVRPAHGGESRGGWLDDLSQLEQVPDELLVGIDLEVPGEDIGIEDVPRRARGDARAYLGLGNEKALGGERADRLAVGAARDAKRSAGIVLVGQERAGRQLSLKN